MDKDLESLYTEARSALKARDYDHASDLLRQILKADVDYKDAAQLLARVIQLSRRRWYNHPRTWGAIGGIAVLALFIGLATRLNWNALIPQSFANQTATLSPTATLRPTFTATLPPTPIPMTWKRIAVGQEFPRDAITAIVIDPKDRDVIYAGTEDAGIYKSIDGGLSWQPVLNGLGRSGVSSLVIDPERPTTLYAGVILGGVYKTKDGARTWQPINTGIALPGGAFLATVVMDPEDHNHLYYTDSLGLYETKDGGENWTRLSMPTCPKIITSLVMPPSVSNAIYIADRERGEECSLGIYTSPDGGNTWEAIPVQISPDLQLSYRSLAVVTEPQERIYISAGTEGDERFYRTTDAGQTWEPIRDHRCTAAVIDPNRDGRFFCAGPDQLLVSQDWGDSWAPALNERLIQEVAVSPHSREDLVAGGDGSGLFFSYTGGREWSRQGSGLGGTYLSLSLSPLDNTSLFVEGGHRLYHSQNSGKDWDFLTDQGNGLAFDAAGKSIYLLADVILKSEDGGKTWQSMPRTTQGITGFLPHPKQPNMLIAIHDAGFSLSLDGGKTWDERDNIAWKSETQPIVGTIFTSLYPDRTGLQFYILIKSETTGKILRLNAMTGARSECRLPARVTNVNLMAIDPRDSNRIVISSPGNGLMASSDGCQSWRDSSSGLASLFVNALVIDQNNPDTIYAGTDGGAFISYDAGATWGQVNEGLLGATVVYSIAVDPEANVYAATPYGIFKLEGK